MGVGKVDMWDYDRLSSITISGVPKCMAEQFLLLAKRMGQSRSGLLKMFMEAAINEAKWMCERDATLRQFSEHSVNDVFSTFGINFLRERQKGVDKPAA